MLAKSHKNKYHIAAMMIKIVNSKNEINNKRLLFQINKMLQNQNQLFRASIKYEETV